MNPFTALTTGVSGAESALLPEGLKGGAPGGGMFAKLLNSETGEINASRHPLLASLGTLEGFSSLNTGEDNAADLLTSLLQQGEGGVTLPTLAIDSEDALTLPQAPLPGSGGENIDTPALADGETVVINPEATPGNTAQDGTATPLPAEVQGDTVPVATTGKAEATGLENARARANENGLPGLDRAASSGSAPNGQPGSTPQQPSAPAATPAQPSGTSPTGNQTPSGNGAQGEFRPAETASAQTFERARNSAGIGQHPDAGEETSSRPTFETTPDTRPRASSNLPPAQTAVLKSIVNPAAGQGLLLFQERIEGETRPLGSMDPAAGGVQLRAVGTGLTATAGTSGQQPAHVPLNAVAVHIAQQAKNGMRRFDIRLDPPELGRIEVRLDMTRDGQVSTHLVVERSETLDLLQRDARALERALQNAGLDTSEGGMKFSLKDQGLAEHNSPDDQNGAGNNTGAQTEGETVEDPRDLPLHPERRYVARTGLDIRI